MTKKPIAEVPAVQGSVKQEQVRLAALLEGVVIASDTSYDGGERLTWMVVECLAREIRELYVAQMAVHPRNMNEAERQNRKLLHRLDSIARRLDLCSEAFGFEAQHGVTLVTECDDEAAE